MVRSVHLRDGISVTESVKIQKPSLRARIFLNHKASKELDVHYQTLGQRSLADA